MKNFEKLIKDKYKWKQPNPKMQLFAIMSSVQGWQGLYESKEIIAEKWAEVSFQLFNEITDLLPFIEKGRW